jgi:hypothetical protein
LFDRVGGRRFSRNEIQNKTVAVAIRIKIRRIVDEWIWSGVVAYSRRLFGVEADADAPLPIGER